MEKPLTPAEAARAAIRVLGGPSQAARCLKVPGNRPGTVQAWLATRVPAEWCLHIEAATRAVGEPVYCEWLRPDVAWHVARQHPAPNG